MKRWLIIIAVLGLLAGCQIEDEGYYTQLTDTVNHGIDAQQEATVMILEAVKDTDLTEKTEEIFAKVDILQDAAIESAKAYDEKVSEDQFQAILDAAIAGNAASTPLNPYAAPVASVLAIISAGYGAMKQHEAKNIGKKYKSHKQGVEEFNRASNNPDAAKEIYDNISDARKVNGV